MSGLLTLPNAIALVMAVGLNAYVLLGGADFGAGVWDLFASGPRREGQRSLIAGAIGPIWEANHVWLILVVVLLFTCYPPAFAQLSIALHIPLTLMLIGIVLRGSAFAFRSYGRQEDEVERRWGLTFSIASFATPVLLGVTIGAVASGRIADPAVATGFTDRFVSPWLTPFALAVGFLALTLFAFLAAVYLTLEADEEALREDFRHRALVAAAAVFVAAWLVLLLSGDTAPIVRRGLTTSPWAIPLHLATGLVAVAAIWALWTRRYSLARIAAATQVSLILWGWLLAQFPYLVPPHLTIAGAAAPSVTLRLVSIALTLGAVVLFPSLYYLLRVFRKVGATGRR